MEALSDLWDETRPRLCELAGSLSQPGKLSPGQELGEGGSQRLAEVAVGTRQGRESRPPASQSGLFLLPQMRCTPLSPA